MAQPTPLERTIVNTTREPRPAVPPLTFSDPVERLGALIALRRLEDAQSVSSDWRLAWAQAEIKEALDVGSLLWQPGR